MKRLIIIVSVLVAVILLTTVGASFYMLSYSLAPDPQRADTAQCFRRQEQQHPEVAAWLDSLRGCRALRDTFVVMPRGERHHAYYVACPGSTRIAVVLHGWRDCAIDFMHLGRVYHELMGCHVLMPDLHAHGLSEGDAIGMGWQERHDVLHWMQVASELFQAHHFVVHGVSMGAATAMNVSGETMPECVKTVRFIEDCGYTSVWDEFRGQLREQFGLPPFPLLYSASLLCRLRYGWSFDEASPLRQVQRCRHPMRFIHGSHDTFVPTSMVHPLYCAKPGQKTLWLAPGSEHAMSFSDHTDEYIRQMQW